VKIDFLPVSPDELKPKPEANAELGFGKIFTDYMFTMKYGKEVGWYDATVRKFENISLSPAAQVYHYAQEIFEGTKAYLQADGKTGMFRPEKNYRRFNNSAKRLCMPIIPEEDQNCAFTQLLKIEKDWFPKDKGSSIYIRPVMIATDENLGAHESSTYLYYIILSPSGSFFSKGFNPISVYVSDTYVRAVSGGVGSAKTGGNYAAGLLAAKTAKDKLCDTVLWLDAIERRYIEEVGQMNIFFVIKNKIVTSPLTDTILEGVTRDSVIVLLRDFGYEVEERNVTINEVIEGIRTGTLTECFGCGTAAVISPVGKVLYRDKFYEISENAGPIAVELFDELTGIQRGIRKDKFGWIKIIE